MVLFTKSVYSLLPKITLKRQIPFWTILVGCLWSFCFSTKNDSPIYFVCPSLKNFTTFATDRLLFYIEASFSQPKLARTLILGHKVLSTETKESFKALGIYHLLIVSGLHVGLFCKIVQSSLKFPISFLYSIKFFSAYQFIKIQYIVDWAIILMCLAYALILGDSPPGQRAAICFITQLFVKHHLPSIRHFPAQLAALCTQMTLFSYNFLSFSNFLSWYIYITISDKALRNKVLSSLTKQLKITFFILACFKSISFIGILVNLIFIPYFNLLFSIFFTSVILSTVQLPQLTLVSESWLTHVLGEWILVSKNNELKPYLYYVFQEDYPFVQQLSIVLSALFLLNTLHKMTKR